MYFKKISKKELRKFYKKMLPTMLLSLLLICIVAFLTGMGSIFPKKKYKIYDNGKLVDEIYMATGNSKTVLDDVVARKKMDRLRKNDKFKKTKKEGENEEYNINVIRGFDVKVNWFGEEIKYAAKDGDKVEAVLEKIKEMKKSDIDLDDPKIYISHPLGDFVMETTKIDVKKIEKVIREGEKEVPIKFPIREKDDSTKPIGYREIETPGENGIKKVYIEEIYHDGEKIQDRHFEKIVKEPKEQVVIVGTKKRAKSLEKRKDVPKLHEEKKEEKKEARKEEGKKRSKSAPQVEKKGPPSSYKKVYTGVSTAYAAKGNTARSGRARPGIVAVDFKKIPAGTHLYVEGYGYCEAGDLCGAAVRGKVLVDVCFNTEAQCRAYGRRVVKVYVLD